MVILSSHYNGVIIVLLSLFLITLLITFLIVRAINNFNATEFKEKTGKGFFSAFYDKGTRLEYVLYNYLCKIYGQDAVFASLYLEISKEKYTEIDLLVVSEEGIYVYEVKNYSGTIYGKSEDRNWTQVLNYTTKNSFYNPLRQNNTHVRAVQNYLRISRDKIVPVIVFSNHCSIQYLKLDKEDHVIKFYQVEDWIRKITFQRKRVMSDLDKERYIEKLKKMSNASEEIKQAHLNQVIKQRENNNTYY